MPLPLPTDFTGPNITEAQFKTAITNLRNYIATMETVAPGVVAYYPASSPPTGWLKANGAAISRTAYSALFAKIGTTYGAGNGSTTFNVPDLRGEFVRGWDDGRGVDTGRSLGSTQNHALQSHTHSFPVYAGDSPTAPHVLASADSRTTHPLVGHIDVSAAGGAETRPRNIALLACIKY